MKLELLKASSNIIDILKKNGVTTIKILCDKTKADLKLFGLTDKEIKQLNIQLQLSGFKLKHSL